MAMSRRQFGVLASTAVAAGTLAACTPTKRSASDNPVSSPAGSGVPASPASVASSSAAAPAPVAAAELAIFPASGAGVNPAIPVTVTAAGGTVSAVTLKSSDGVTVPGKISADGTGWTAAGELGYKRSYTLTATAASPDGTKTTRTAHFSTVSPGNLTMPYLNTRGGGTLVSGSKYGVGFVIRVHFDEQISNRAAAERALLVTTEPTEIEGSWFWLDNQNALYRPKVYYPSGTKVTVAANVYGVEVGPGLYGQANASASFEIGPKHYSIADDKTHQVRVYFDDKFQRSMPTSMGKGGYTTGTSGQQISFFTPAGIYTVLDQNNPVLMTSASYGLPGTGPGSYSELIPWATRITTDGIYLHELDTTVWAQGNTDTSHGCLNLNRTNASWFYKNAQIGDVVQIVHTGGVPGALWQNADWSLPWSQWVAGSALRA
jgi:lipoprotein-anchoring transpeptidase ErfK/SrfK